MNEGQNVDFIRLFVEEYATNFFIVAAVFVILSITILTKLVGSSNNSQNYDSYWESGEEYFRLYSPDLVTINYKCYTCKKRFDNGDVVEAYGITPLCPGCRSDDHTEC